MRLKFLVQALIVGGLLGLLCACATTRIKPTLPCKSPEELMRAADYACNANDTNLLWELHDWTDVAPVYQRFHQRILLQFLPYQAGDKSFFKSFRIAIPLPPDFQEIATRTNVTKPHYNIPLEGVIYCDVKFRFISDHSSFHGLEFPFGRLPDGTYRFAVMIKAPRTNAVPPQQ